MTPAQGGDQPLSSTPLVQATSAGPGLSPSCPSRPELEMGRASSWEGPTFLSGSPRQGARVCPRCGWDTKEREERGGPRDSWLPPSCLLAPFSLGTGHHAGCPQPQPSSQLTRTLLFPSPTYQSHHFYGFFHSYLSLNLAFLPPSHSYKLSAQSRRAPAGTRPSFPSARTRLLSF